MQYTSSLLHWWYMASSAVRRLAVSGQMEVPSQYSLQLASRKGRLP
jgi:hypothetical protein